MSIRIDNESRYVILTRVSAYIISKQMNFSNYDIPSKTTPTVDTDAFSVKPTTYRITARITAGQYSTLTTMKGEADEEFTIDDGGPAKINLRIESIEFSINPGFMGDDMWNVTIGLTATDH